MKIRIPHLHSRQGNTLVLTLVITGLLGFLLVAYLSLVRSQNISNMRSQSWNQTIPVIEAGIEDALTHLNVHGTTNLNCDNWNQLGSIYYMKRWVGDNYYVVTISNWVAGTTNFNAPVIESRGFVTMPVIMAGNPGPFLADAADASAQYLGRGVRVTAQQDLLFTKGLVAKGKIDMNGNNVQTDSFDSSDPLYSTAGRWDQFKPRKAHGDVATAAGLTNSINVANANIWGHVSTGPNGTVSIGPLGSVGDTAWQMSGRKGIEPGFFTDDMNVTFPDAQVPFQGGVQPTEGTNNGVRYDYMLTTDNYEKDTLGSGTMLVAGNAQLYVPGDVSLSGITILSNASLRLYVGGASASLSGNGVINNGGNATNFFYYGLPSNTSLSVSGNGSFTGVLYAPQADLRLNGGGHDRTDFIGASVTKTATLNGHFNFHYDEALSKYGPPRAFVINSWNEMSPQEVSAGIIDTSPQGVIH